MFDVTNHQRLRTIITQQSENPGGFIEGIKEWRVISYDINNTYSGCCSCGRKGIKHIFVIENRINGKQLAVGQSCVNYIFSNEYFPLMAYFKRAITTENWLPTKGMVDFAVSKNYISDDEGNIIKRYISQRLRITGMSIHAEVCRCTRRLLVNLMIIGGMSEDVIFKVLSKIPRVR